jgi:hypothetical protein
MSMDEEEDVGGAAAPEAVGEDAGDRKTVEQWAAERGLAPSTPTNPQQWKFTAAAAVKGWAEGQFVTEEEFDEAIASVTSTPLR